MKFKLVTLSFLPIFILTPIKNAPFMKCFDYLGLNEITYLLVMLSCLAMLILSLIFLQNFKSYKRKAAGDLYTVSEVIEDKKCGLDFLLTFLLPILYELDNYGSSVSFILIITLLYWLVLKTNYIYDNPILTLLGYRVYKFNATGSDGVQNNIIALSSYIIENNNRVKYLSIDENIWLVKVVDIKISDHVIKGN